MKHIAISICLIFFLATSCKEKANNTPTEKFDTEKISNKNLTPEINQHQNNTQDALDNIAAPPVVDHFICFKDDDNSRRMIWISYTEKEVAIEIKYKGQKNSIPLVFEKEIYEEGGAHPTIHKLYNEIYDGKINGSYKLTHSGNWDYVEYTRGKDGKKFNFTIDHNANPYGKEPCF